MLINSWELILGGDGMDNEIDYVNENIIYASVQNGTFFRSDDKGYTFNQLITPTDFNTSGAWVTPMKLHPTVPSTVFIGYQGLYKSLDKGETWLRLSDDFTASSGISLKYFDIAKSNSNYLYATDDRNLYKSINGGINWSVIAEPLTYTYPGYRWIEIHPENPNILWVASYYGLFSSTNGGSSWTNVSNGLPNVSINSIVYDDDSNGNLFVGTDLGVYYKNNSSTSWQKFGQGLPNVEITEVDVFEAGNILRCGTYGRGIWEIPIGEQIATCSDGIQNGDETGLDCGGSYCQPCPCEDSPFVITGIIPDGTNIKTSKYISSSGILYSPGNAYFQAQEYINLNLGFEIKHGATFVAYAKNCFQSQGKILVNSNRHIVTYEILNDEIKFLIDLIQDFNNDLGGTYPDVDFCAITSDFNRNNQKDEYLDRGWSIDESGTCSYYLVSNGTTYCGYFESLATSSVHFGPTSNESNDHVYFIISIPKEELSSTNGADIVIRIHEADRGSEYYPTDHIYFFTSTLEFDW